MGGKMLLIIIALGMMVSFFIVLEAYSYDKNVELNIDTINYKFLEIVSNQGMVTEDLYNTLEESISKFGDFTIAFKLKVKIKNDVYDIYFDKNEIIDRPLKVGDTLTCFIESEDETLIGRIINSATLSVFSLDEYITMKYQSNYEMPITKDYE